MAAAATKTEEEEADVRMDECRIDALWIEA